MRVLMTGFTTHQIGKPGQLGVISIPKLLADGLRAAGHRVDHRKPALGEPLGDYDVVLVGHQKLHAFTSAHRWTALDVITRARREGCGLGFYVSDWRVHELPAGFEHVRLDKQRLLKPFFTRGRSDEDVEYIRRNLDDLYNTVCALKSKQWPSTLIPSFLWGDTNRFERWIPSRSPWCLDPTSLVEPPANGALVGELKERVWVSASLPGANTEWLDAQPGEWPVEIYGHPKAGYPKVPESEIVKRYGEVWGVISTPHVGKVAGTGWWRVRFVHAAQQGCVLVADEAELGNLDAVYRIKRPAVEKLSDSSLRTLAAEQAAELYDWATPRDTTLAELDQFIKEAAA